MYDLLLRDATLVSPSGRLVADVAVKNGRIAYVGPRPPRRRSRREVSAIGKFLMPGVIDTAVDFGADWKAESAAAVTGGVTTVVAVPTAEQPAGNATQLKKRAKAAKGASWAHYGFWADANATKPDKLAKLLEDKLAVGVLLALGEDDLASLVAISDLDGPVAVTDTTGIEAGAPWLAGVLELARAKERAIHFLQLSTAGELHALDPVRGEVPVTSGVTPHHLFLSTESEFSQPVQTLPPLRPEGDRRALWTALKRGRMDCLLSDHRLPDAEGNGVPGVELLLPLMLSAVRNGRLSLELLVELCAAGPARVLGLTEHGQVAEGMYADLVLFSENELARIGHEDMLTAGGWTPYLAREIAPKPELVVVGGQVVAERGKLVGDAPGGQLIRREA